MTGLLENEDCTSFFDSQTFPPGKAGEMTDRYVDVLAGAGVTALLCNTNARRTNYTSKVWQSFWDGYDPDGPDDQPFLAGLPEDQRKHCRKRIHKIWGYHNQGVDYPGRMIQRCRHNGISPWISLRMNDVHCNDNLNHPFHGDFWRKPECFRKGHPGYYARCLDYAHPEVRDQYKALIVETLDRYDIDGLELDFMREPYVFSAGEEQAGAKILTEWLREIRQLVNKATADRKHPIQIGVRIPFDPDTTLGLGLDAPTWAKEGLVNLVIVAPRWGTLHFDMPMGKWRELLGGRVTLAGGLDVNYQPYPAGPRRVVDPEYATGAAVAVLAGGADIVYLFNYFQRCLPWSIPEYQRTLKAFSSLDEACKLPRRHGVTYRDVVVPGETYQAPLPASGRELTFALPLGPKPPADWQAAAIIEVEAKSADGGEPAVTVNGVAGQLRDTKALERGTREMTYTIPVNALPGENKDKIAVAASGGKPIKVLRVEVRLTPPGDG
ncbi:MAG: hypothetical protein AB1696_04430 [Planctomycetota bacterium]